jgi:hypothetical protein
VKLKLVLIGKAIMLDAYNAPIVCDAYEQFPTSRVAKCNDGL